MIEQDPILLLNLPGGFYCMQDGRVFAPSTFPEFLVTAQSLLLKFVLLRKDKPTPGQDKVLASLQAEITHGWELPR